MRRIVLIALGTAAAAASLPSPALASGAIGSEWPGSYALPPHGNKVQDVLARLEQVCESKRRADRRRCAEGWRIINAAHTRLKTERAAKD